MTLTANDTIFLPDWRNRYPFEAIRMGQHMAIDPAHCCCSIPELGFRIRKRGKEIGKLFVLRAHKKTGLIYVRRIA